MLTHGPAKRVMVSIIDEESRIQRFLPSVEAMVKEGLVAVSDIEVIRSVHRATPSRGENP